MNPNPDPLEKFINDTVRGLPPKRAPRSLESRVLAEIARREALPWWRRSWTYWPTLVKGGFLVVSAATAAAMIMVFLQIFRGGSFAAVSASLSRPLEMAKAVWAACLALGSVGQDLVNIVPPVWLYSTLGAVAALYITVFGVGAAAYRTLYQTR